MREILFCGQTRKYGEKVRLDGKKIPGNCVYGGIYRTYSNSDYAIIYTYDTYEKMMVYNDTVGQYTGLTDKNGVKIFEGDILKTTNSNCIIWFVDYKPSAFCANQGNANYSCILDDFIKFRKLKLLETSTTIQNC